MCLSRIKKRFITEDDIICYKIVKKINNNYRSKFYNFPYKIGETYESKIVDNFEYRWTGIDYVLSPTVEKALHSYKHLVNAKMALKERYEGGGSKLTILKCIIPKGSECYEGMFYQYINYDYYAFESYASDTIKIIEEI